MPKDTCGVQRTMDMILFSCFTTWGPKKNSGCQISWQEPLPVKPSHHPHIHFSLAEQYHVIFIKHKINDREILVTLIHKFLEILSNFLLRQRVLCL